MYYEEKCKIICTDNGNEVTADIVEFKPHSFVTLAINKSVRINLKFDSKKSHYIGKMSDLEFITDGPNKININRGRT
tara:strand:+ start:227 stop:457 length:231 start_codon:yes stop_codon:yes gene_type:complete